jgi:aminoglycoside phosphotransferase (APT) family kinase protein
VIDSVLAAAPRWDEVLAQLRSGPPTLVHNDFRLDNIIFRPDGTPVILDWQVPAIGRGTHDLAFLLAGSMDYDLLKDSWRPLGIAIAASSWVTHFPGEVRALTAPRRGRW